MLESARELADQGGLEALSMRALGQALGVEAMSLYRHVRGKPALLSGLVDLVLEEVEQPQPGADWRGGMARRARSLFDMLRAHPWAIGLMESQRTPGPTALAYYDAVLGCLRTAGFPLTLAAHAFALLDSYVYGFALQDQKLPSSADGSMQDVTDEIVAALPEGQYPHVEELAREHVRRPGYDFAAEFDWGLELLLDGLAERLAESSELGSDDG